MHYRDWEQVNTHFSNDNFAAKAEIRDFWLTARYLTSKADVPSGFV